MANHLPLLPTAEPPRRRHPEWLKVPMPSGPGYTELRKRVGSSMASHAEMAT